MSFKALMVEEPMASRLKSSNLPLAEAYKRLKLQTETCNHQDLPPPGSAIDVLVAISCCAMDMARRAVAEDADDARVLTELKFIQSWASDTYDELADIMMQSSKTDCTTPNTGEKL